MLGSLSIGGGVPSPGVGDVNERSQVSLPSCPECMKTALTSQFPTLFALKIAENTIFYLKVLNKICSRDVFLRNSVFLKYSILKVLRSSMYLFKVLEVIYAPGRTD